MLRVKCNTRFLLYAHCNAHCLNLIFDNVVKSGPKADYNFAFFAKPVYIMSSFAVHIKWIDVPKQLDQEKPRKLETRDVR